MLPRVIGVASIGQAAPAHGVPVASVLAWDTGVQMAAGWQAIDVVSDTRGTRRITVPARGGPMDLDFVVQ